MKRIIKTKKYYEGFTLAEVLITLSIIGVVASMTIPILMNQIQDAQFKTAYKKAYSVACQAWQKAYTDNLLVPQNSTTGDPANDTNFAAFESELDVVKDCPAGNPYNCWSSDGLKWDIPSGGYPKASAHAFIDKSGMVWTQPTSGHYFFFVDVNGDKKPNDWGKDRFPFKQTVKGSSSDGNIPNNVSLWIGDMSAGDASCPGTHVCYYQSWIIGAH